MNIFIDSQYKDIYGGEFKNLVEKNIIEPLSKNHNLIISKSYEETRNLLTNSHFDIIFCTGYSAEFLSWITNAKGTKLISLIYEMNAEKFYTSLNNESFVFQKITAEKAKIIFLSSAIITFSETSRNELSTLYSYFNQNIDKKIYKLDIETDRSKENKKYNRIIDNKYFVLTLTNNSLSDTILIPPLVDILNPDIDYKIVCPIIGKVNKALYQMICDKGFKDKIIFMTDFSKDEIESLYHYACASLFMGEHDINLENIMISLNNDCITLLNDNNEFYHELFDDNISYLNPDENINDVFETFLNVPKDIKNDILEIQYEAINSININGENINRIINNVFA